MRCAQLSSGVFCSSVTWHWLVHDLHLHAYLQEKEMKHGLPSAVQVVLSICCLVKLFYVLCFDTLVALQPFSH
jgi:hypothetical protein